MGSVVDDEVGEIELGEEREREFDVEETIFVAVSKKVEESKTMLFWAIENFAGKRICVLHVHQPQSVAELTNRYFYGNRVKQLDVESLMEVERQKMHELLDQYRHVLLQEGVEADKVWIETDNIEKGIVDIVARHNIRWLVMGAAAEKYYSKKLVELKSKKAIFVCQQAPTSCNVWFVCKGCLIYTRGGRKDKSDLEIAPPLLLLNSDMENELPENLESESLTDELRFLESCADAEQGVNDLERISRSFSLQCSSHSNSSTDMLVGTSMLTSWPTHEEENTQGQEAIGFYSRLEQVIRDAKSSKHREFEEVVKRWKEEDNAMEARCKAKALEDLCAKELTQKKEIEEALTREKKEKERMKNRQDELMKELQMVQDQKSILEGQLEESKSTAQELEEKIISAVELLISFKEKRDRLRIEHGNAVAEVKKLSKLLNGEVSSFCSVQIPTLSFMEINELTHDFDPSRKIGEGRYGTVYRGILRHMHVAIKMLPSYGSQSQLDFQKEVEVLSRVRHPNLVTLIGTCPESRSLVYEYLKNGSLADHLACKDNTTPLSWKIRTQIVVDICSALIFLHSNKPCIIHGNLKPSKVLLDANFVSKLGDLGIFRLIPQKEHPAYTTKLCNNLKGISMYMDPEYLETGKLTPESDIYSFGILMLQILTGRPLLSVVKDVKCALENGNFNAVLDFSAGDWPLEQAKQLAQLGLRCCEKHPLNRPDLVLEIWPLLEPMKASCVASASCLVSKKLHRIPSHFMCPIYQEVMTNPQIAADGYTYESEAIRGWFDSGHDTSPMTNLKLEHCKLVPNYALQNAILEWNQQL
ncbi:U-box domain-containing protein 32 isoform X9 [Quercus robur]|uniref:U-box domain-containing protein 32 isoform X9 n=1 Tax=Quercus robur TaxID=38942 RepID=UPI0021626263|nr:U-box domain-containing protein 32 isoform X9 [Quercus robur]